MAVVRNGRLGGQKYAHRSKERGRPHMEKDEGRLREKLGRLEAELLERKREEERYRSIIEHQSELICRYRRDGKLTFVNDAYCRFFGMRREELIGSDFKNLIPEQDRKQIGDMIDAMNGGMPFFAHEHRVFKPGGKIGWQLWTNRAVFDDRGNIVEYQGVGHDITDRILAERALKESEARYRTIFETTAAATMIIEEDMTVFMVNTEFERQSGYGKAEVERKMKWTEFIADGEGMLQRMIEYHHLRRLDEAAAPRNYEFRFRDKVGQVRDVFMTIAMIPGTSMSVASLLDISERKKAEKELQEREQELEIKSRNLEELNTALKVLLKHREDDKEELEERILSNVKELVLPYLEKLKKTPLKSDQLAYTNIIESNLNDIISPFLRKMTSKYLNLTPREIQIATLIREGRTTKEISEVLKISSRAVEFHRDNIRIKLGLKKKKANLRSFLLSLS